MALGKRIRIMNEPGTASVPALLIPMEDRAIVIEAHPHDVGRKHPLNGAFRTYFASTLYRMEEIDTFEISDDLAERAKEFAYAVEAFHAAASPMQFMEGLV
jgi:hypothetical protein